MKSSVASKFSAERQSSDSLPTLLLVGRLSPRTKELTDLLGQGQEVSLVKSANALNATAMIQKKGRLVLLFPFEKEQDIYQISNLALTLKKQLRQNLLRILVDDQVGNPRITDHLTKLGCQEIFSQFTSTKALKLKVERHLIYVENTWKDFQKTQNKLASKHERDSEKIKWISPIDGKNDFWIIQDERDIQKIMGKWVVNLTGPGPETGKWIESKDRLNEPKTVWTWQFRQKNFNSFLQQKGDWIFRGIKPEFRGRSWCFIGDAPSLVFHATDQTEHGRFRSNSTSLEVAHNSEFALNLLPQIEATFEKEIEIKGNTSKSKLYSITVSKEQGRDINDQRGEDEKPHDWNFNVSKTIDPGRNKDLQGKMAKAAKFRAKTSSAQSPFSGPGSIFHPIDDRIEREALLQESLDLCEAVTLWASRMDIRVHAKFVTLELDTGRIVLSRMPQTTSQELRDFYSKMISRKNKDVFVNFNLHHGAIFFVCASIELIKNGNGLRVVPGRIFYQVQRRNQFRLAVPPEKKMNASINGQKVKLLNISTGGMAIVSDQKSRNILKKGNLLKDVRFRISGKTILAQAEVRWTKTKEGDPYKGQLAAGLMFLNVRGIDAQTISFYIMTESYKYIQKYIL